MEYDQTSPIIVKKCNNNYHYKNNITIAMVPAPVIYIVYYSTYGHSKCLTHHSVTSLLQKSNSLITSLYIG
jgi:hypothetical protein